MSDVMLLGVLRMPPEMWNGDALDVHQRHGRYLEAADTIEELRDEVDALRAERPTHQDMKDISEAGKLMSRAASEITALRAENEALNERIAWLTQQHLAYHSEIDLMRRRFAWL